jgi:hypothetical protein
VAFVDDILAAASSLRLSDRRGLYIGCGNGRNLVPLVEGGLDLLGLDVSPTAISQLQERCPDRAERLVVGDLASLPVAVTFPVVIGIQVFQHGSQAEAHQHISSAQARVAKDGLFCLRVNAVDTDVWPSHDVIEQASDGSFTVRYTAGPKEGLDVHFFARRELDDLFADQFEPVVPLRRHRTERSAPAPGQWTQWEAIWRRKGRPDRA